MIELIERNPYEAASPTQRTVPEAPVGSLRQLSGELQMHPDPSLFDEHRSRSSVVSSDGQSHECKVLPGNSAASTGFDHHSGLPGKTWHQIKERSLVSGAFQQTDRVGHKIHGQS
jgi:hypothetical protein